MKFYNNPSIEIVIIAEDDIVRTSTFLNIMGADDGIEQEINHPDL